MLRKEFTIIFTIILLILSPHRVIYPSDGENPENTRDFRVIIHMERYTFYSDEVVELKMQIKNNSYRKLHLYVYDDLYTTFQPVVYDMNGREADNIVPYKLMNKNIYDILKLREPRIIPLSPNETFIHSINLKEIYKLDIEKEYRVRGFFFPNANTPAALSGENVLTFRILETEKPIQKSGIKRIKHNISPSEIVYLFLNSEKDRNWENHLKYIKIRSYINSFSDFVKRYNNSDDTEKLKVEEDFIKFLSRERGDYILDFKIVEENLLKDRNIAYVDAIVKRFEIRIPSIYKYKYTLEKFRDFWLITDVEATVMKGGLK